MSSARSTSASRAWHLGGVLALLLAACVSVPGSTAAEKRAHVDAFAEESLRLLVEQSPQLASVVESAAGTLVLRQSSLKVPVFGAGSGWGVIEERASGERTYVKVRRLDFGAGWGARAERVIAILKTPEAVERALGGGFKWGLAAEAGAKAGDVGGGAQGSPGAAQAVEDVEVHVLLETGASATATFGIARYSRLSSLD